MRWNVSGLLKGAIGETREYTETEELGPIFEEAVPTAPLSGTVRLTHTNRGILADANLSTRVRLVCGRCLSDFEQEIRLRFEEEFLSTIDIGTGLPIQIDDPDAFTIGPDHILDITDAVRQYSLLAIPMQPLCRPDCAGLCLSCGKDLNAGPCGCGEDNLDPRLARLKGLLDETAPEDQSKTID